MSKAYKVRGRVSASDNMKTVVVDRLTSRNEAIDYVAMFFSIDEIEFIKEGTVVHGIFEEDVRS